MPTIIDSLFVEFGFKVDKVPAQRKAVEDNLKKTREAATSTAKDIEGSSKAAGEMLLKLRNNILGLFAAFTAGKGLKEFVSDMTTADAAVGRTAATLDMSTQSLAGWQAVAQLTGGSAAGITATMQGFSQQLQQFAITGQSAISPYIRAITAAGHFPLKFNKDGAVDVTDFLKKTADVFQHMDPARALAFAQGLGIDQATFNAMRLGGKALQDLIDKEHAYAAAIAADAPEAAKRQAAFANMKLQFETIGLVLLTDLSPALIKIANALAAVAEWGERHPEIVAAGFAALTAVVTTLSAVMAGVFVTGALASAITALATLQGGVVSLMTFLGILTETALPALADAFIAVGVAIEATPVGWIITAIAAVGVAVYELYEHWDDLRRWWKHLWGDLTGDADDGADKINNSVKKVRGGGVYGKNAQEKSADLIEGLEGFRTKAYWDKNAYRVGYGSDTVTDPTTGAVTPVTANTTVTREQANADIQRRINNEFLPKAADAIGKAAWDKLSDQTKAAIVSITYNYGSTPKSVVAAAQSGSAQAVANAILARRGDNGGENAKRRQLEAEVAIAGTIIPDGTKKAINAAAQGGSSPFFTNLGGAKQLASISSASNDNRSSTSNSTTQETNINTLVVNSAAKDAPGIAGDIRSALSRDTFAQQANYGPA